MRLVIFGRTGQVARELARRAPEARLLGRDEADLTDPDACARRIAGSGAEAVINAAAWTAVDKAETERETAHAVNGAAPAAMARAAAAAGIPFVHISTDYVFDGTGDRPWRPRRRDRPARRLRRDQAGGRGGGARGRRTARGPAHLVGVLGARRQLREDHAAPRGRARAPDHRRRPDRRPDPRRGHRRGVPCHRRAARRGAGGVRHLPFLRARPTSSWADFARAIFAAAGLEVAVEDIPSSDYPTPAPRPLNSRLDCSATETAFGISRPDWRAGLREVLDELG